MIIGEKKISYPGDSDFIYLDDEEKKIIETNENDQNWRSIKNTEELKIIIETARQHCKNKSITLRIAEKDYEGIKEKAAEEGLPYQTLITSIIHKYITGQLKQVK